MSEKEEGEGEENKPFTCLLCMYPRHLKSYRADIQNVLQA